MQTLSVYQVPQKRLRQSDEQKTGCLLLWNLQAGWGGEIMSKINRIIEGTFKGWWLILIEGGQDSPLSRRDPKDENEPVM